MNGVPVYLPALSGPFRFTKDQPIQGIGPLQATLFFRDLDWIGAASPHGAGAQGGSPRHDSTDRN